MALIPIWSAAAWLTSCIRELVRRTAVPNAAVSCSRSGGPDPAPNGSAHGVSQPGGPAPPDDSGRFSAMLQLPDI